jgi:hypothetical protein
VDLLADRNPHTKFPADTLRPGAFVNGRFGDILILAVKVGLRRQVARHPERYVRLNRRSSHGEKGASEDVVRMSSDYPDLDGSVCATRAGIP